MPIQEISRLLELSLLHNDFQFNNKWYLQISGTAMGKRYAPSFANIFMAIFEQEVLAKTNLKPYIMFRFIDDIFMIYTGGRTKLNIFLAQLNTLHSSIKFDYATSTHSIAFLDTNIYIDNNKRITNHSTH